MCKKEIFFDGKLLLLSKLPVHDPGGRFWRLLLSMMAHRLGVDDSLVFVRWTNPKEFLIFPHC